MIDLYSAQASFAWPRVDLARPLRRILDYQLFRERLSEKVHTTIPKGIVGGFEFSVFQRNLKELARKAMEMCLRVLKESNKSRFNSYSRQEQSIDHNPCYLSGLSRANFFPTTFLEIAVSLFLCRGI